MLAFELKFVELQNISYKACLTYHVTKQSLKGIGNEFFLLLYLKEILKLFNNLFDSFVISLLIVEIFTIHVLFSPPPWM